jgi:hypothetical protein
LNICGIEEFPYARQTLGCRDHAFGHLVRLWPGANNVDTFRVARLQQRSRRSAACFQFIGNN